ncbi:hypothetical protein GCM10009678_28130 [Actinomadura kijaniata]|uniref:DUF4190 domain-containing protein n=1 Tax=Actinomadura namibiensis TaxID=182080 RepID=A0A7W3LKC9_ACTNM|nr:hypothetical protein [Actinomadura namibiensis]MBA8949746.1 hypothetical protein [Actinomadura namibiensis]
MSRLVTSPSAPSGPDEPLAWAAPDAPAAPAPPTAPSEVPTPSPAGRPRLNRFAIVTVGFGIAALVQIGRRGERGRALATGGLAAATAWLFAVGVITIVALGELSGPRRDASGRVSAGGGRTLAPFLRPGDCFVGLSARRPPTW